MLDKQNGCRRIDSRSQNSRHWLVYGFMSESLYVFLFGAGWGGVRRGGVEGEGVGEGDGEERSDGL